MDIGTRVHKLCESYARGELKYESIVAQRLEEEPEQVRNGFPAYLAWVAETGFIATEVEKVIAGDGYAGTVDAIGILRDGRRGCLSIGRRGRRARFIQSMFCNGMPAAALAIESGFIVSFDTDTGEAHEFPVKFDTVTYNAFLAARNLWEWMEEHKK